MAPKKSSRKKPSKRELAAKQARARELKRARDARYRERHREEKRARDRAYQAKRRAKIKAEKAKAAKKHGENRGERTKENGGTVEIRWSGKILIGGPAASEESARRALRDAIYENLSRCEMFDASGLADRYADEIADQVEYVEAEDAPPIVRIDSFDAIYRNPPNTWKWWSRVRSGDDTIDPGEWA